MGNKTFSYEETIILESKLSRIKDDLKHSSTVEEELSPVEENFSYQCYSKIIPLIVSLPGMITVGVLEGLFTEGYSQFTFQTLLWLFLYSFVPGFIALALIAVYATVNELHISLSEAFGEILDKDAIKEITAIQKSLATGQSKSVPVRDILGRTALEKMGKQKGLDLFIRIEPKDVLLEWAKMDKTRPVDNTASIG